ncbi:hypothetical protein JTB14_008826 [Gonioctena quinquepunctata]|nr:hypothetical protein JTB14_008826 [Gonioctena quinquepunctata]
MKLSVVTFAVLLAYAAASPFGDILGAGEGVLEHAGNGFGIEADAHAEIAGHHVGVEGDAGIGRDGIGAHGAGATDIFGHETDIHTGVGEHHGHHGHHGHHEHHGHQERQDHRRIF